MDRETLIERARALVPVLAERAQHCEDLRRLPDETLADFVEAGFYRILQPAKYGGYELSPTVSFEVAIELARGCPSSAWCMSLIAIHNWEVGLLDPRVADDLWSEDQSVRYSSSYAPLGVVEEVDGGYRLSGRWPWSSGCDHCSWVMVGARGAKRGDAPDPLSLLVPRSDYEIIDTWHVMGLKGTGSKDIVIDDVFVPAHRAHHFLDSFAMQDPGRATFSGPSYRYPFGLVFGMCLGSVAMGIAEAALATAREQLTTRHSAVEVKPATDDPFVLQRFGEAHSSIRSDRMRFDSAFPRMDAYLDRGEALPLELRAEIHWDIQRIARSNRDAVGLLFECAGGSGVRLENPMQRYFRDIQTVTHHAFLNVDRGAANFGGVMLEHPTEIFTL